MVWMDWIIVGILLVSVGCAARKGFVMEAFSLAGVILGLLLASWNYEKLVPWGMRWIHPQQLVEILSFLSIAFGVMILAGLTGKSISMGGAVGRPGMGRPRHRRHLRVCKGMRGGNDRSDGVSCFRSAHGLAGAISNRVLLSIRGTHHDCRNPGRFGRADSARDHHHPQVTAGLAAAKGGRRSTL